MAPTGVSLPPPLLACVFWPPFAALLPGSFGAGVLEPEAVVLPVEPVDDDVDDDVVVGAEAAKMYWPEKVCWSQLNCVYSFPGEAVVVKRKVTQYG